ncbi:MAG TPA: ATP-binding protein [Hydrogenophaga sp.]|uniref:hybrid sensor histidine kinase/response regulator n=1 Tax=Hydrogenophaga sp. TaxID=1904254 RepID=UPI002D0A2131|nr:ATP-binding protein [Hydrogenophaga sp.]HMN93900.1 ATP-binding protein [Hydrogenophaga sp.]HMP11502.1 ATP-binding protein [Hydrogenophaga sp.]
MLPDLYTLLLVRLGVDGLIAVAFWGLMRRYPGIGGPGWWTSGALLSILGTLMLMERVAGAGPLLGALAGLLLFASHAFAWMGLRSYLRLPPSWQLFVLMLAAQMVLQLGAALRGDQPGFHQLAYSLMTMLLTGLVLRDLLGQRTHRLQPEYRDLAALTVFEMLLLLGAALWVTTSRQSLDTVAAGFMLMFLLTKFLRVLLFGALVSLRLRQEADQARLAMARRNADSRALVNNLEAGVVVLRPDRSVESANRASCRFFGWPADGQAPESIPSLARWQLLREDGARMPRHEMPFERVLGTGQPVREVVIGIPVEETGATRWALCNAYPENDAQGGLRHVVLTFVDITSLRSVQAEQKALQSQLAQSQKMEALGTLAGGVAHDFNNILAAILGNAELARRDLPRDAPARESLHEISTAARRGRELVRQILAFSRRQPLERTPVDVRAVVNEACVLLRTALPPQVQLVQDCACNTPPIQADATQLGQVFLNLGTNAVHALKGGSGRIEYLLDALPADDPGVPAEIGRACLEAGVAVVRLRVRDNGCGMSEAVRNRIFEPFFTTKPVGQGTGLGLPVVLGIVEAHGGTVSVRSEEGQGTEFGLFFPAAAATSASALGNPNTNEREPVTMSHAHPDVPTPESVPMTETSSAEPRHILYLDDDDTLVFLVRRLLERRGYRVTGVSDQQQAIDAVRANPEGFDLMLTDYNMPGMSGIEVAEEVLRIRPSLAVAVASGYINDELEQKARAAGVREVVFKTDAIESFCEVVERLSRPDT